MAQAAGYPAGYLDPTYRQVMDRFLALAEKFRFRYSMYAIGQDLEDPHACMRLRGIATAGHEIGNHTWNHYTDLGALKPLEMREEVVRTHERLTEIIGTAPRGFIAPAWSYSERLMRLLGELGYEYDMSLFPSLLYYPFVFKNAINHIGNSDKLLRVLNRRDWAKPFFGSRDPFVRGNIVVIPVPTTPGPLGIAVWHTTGFLLGWERHFQMMRDAIHVRRYFHYVIHPADLTCDEDFTGNERMHLERAGGSLAEKMKRMEECFTILAESGRNWTTVGELARAARVELSESLAA
ncbi:MAG: polysaccharide deacetylase family protein [Bryobacteraceae bacterium]